MNRDRHSATHLLLIPSYNTGPIVIDTIRRAAKAWGPLWIVIDGSTDDSPQLLEKLVEEELPDVRLLRLERNQGKGAAIFHALRDAMDAGLTHVLCFDSDGQHPDTLINRYMELSFEHPDAMILGKPVFGKDAPIERVLWRKVSNFIASVLILSRGIGDTLFGMRVYPIKPLFEVMNGHRHARRFDFDTEVAVRLAWRGVPAVNVPTKVRYPSKDEGGVSQFRYLRDNFLLGSMYVRLAWKFLMSWPRILRNRSEHKTTD